MVASGNIRVLFAGGGTGGHLYPAIRLAEGLREYARENGTADPVIAFVGNPDGLEGRILQGKETFYPIQIQGFHRGDAWTMFRRNLGFVPKLLHGYSQSRRILDAFHPDVLVGTGGYVSGPPLLAAVRRGIPTLIQEQNSFPGITTRLLAKWVDEIHVNYQEAASRLDGTHQIHLTGNPVRKVAIDMTAAAAKQELGIQEETFLITVIGGSQGAEPINRHLAGRLEWYRSQDGLSLLWQCGTAHLETYRHHQSQDLRIQVKGFLENMDVVHAASDLIIGRAGALTISELAMVGTASILIPLPTAAANHQYHNARSYANQGAAVVVEQSELPEGKLEDTIVRLRESPEQLGIMATCARGQAKPNATRDIINAIYNLAQEVTYVSEV
ncbi:MAG TPA: undecaprenyldiphospho-muramoylpentapeptide beta-N-acetylglucosaminyltransferase [bacterium]|nr:undecaprenyldiphospho-muramoylpentapeptide beta-N-acetylglucosaminyltransferase [bacterium]